MNMLRFKNCGTHIKDEEYMNKMSGKGFQTKSLVEGFWVFERGKKNKYVYRVYYFRSLLSIGRKKKLFTFS